MVDPYKKSKKKKSKKKSKRWGGQEEIGPSLVWTEEIWGKQNTQRQRTANPHLENAYINTVLLIYSIFSRCVPWYSNHTYQLCPPMTIDIDQVFTKKMWSTQWHVHTHELQVITGEDVTSSPSYRSVHHPCTDRIYALLQKRKRFYFKCKWYIIDPELLQNHLWFVNSRSSYSHG